VDDIIITGNSSSLIQKITYKLHHVFALEQLGSLDYFLGLEIKHQPNGSLLLTQAKNISDLSKTDMSDANPVTTPMVSSTKLSKTGSVFC